MRRARKKRVIDCHGMHDLLFVLNASASVCCEVYTCVYIVYTVLFVYVCVFLCFVRVLPFLMDCFSCVVSSEIHNIVAFISFTLRAFSLSVFFVDGVEPILYTYAKGMCTYFIKD